MRIAFVTQPWASPLPPSESVAIWTREVAKRLAERHEVVVLARGTGPPVRESGVEYRFVRGRGDYRLEQALRRFDRFRPADRPLFASPLYAASYHAGLLRELRADAPDVVHVPTFSQLIPVVSRACPGAKVVLNVRDEMLSRMSPGMVARRLRSADLVIGCSEFVSAGLRTAFPEAAPRVLTVYPGVDVERFTPGGEPAPDGPVQLVYVGRISPEKGVHVLLEAFAQLENLPVELTIAGDERGQLPPEMLRLLGVEQAPLAGPAEVKRLGKLPHDELPDVYRRADVLVAPSLREAFGKPIVEAMASGLPVVASRTGGIPEAVVDGETGLLVAPGAPGALAQALRRMVGEPELRGRLGRAGRARAVERFSYDRIAAELEHAYSSSQ